MQHKPSCAVIIASYNGEKYLTEQIQSIKSQIGVKVDIFFSDDSSNDGSYDILLKSGCIDLNDSGVSFKSSAQNFLHAMLKFGSVKKFDYILLSDQDDIWLPNKIIGAIEQLLVNEAECYSGSYYSWKMHANKMKYVNKSYVQNEIDFYFRSPGPGFTFCFTSSAFKKIQNSIKEYGPNLKYVRWHDWFIYALARSKNINWFIDRNSYSLYRLHGDNDTGQITSLHALIFRLHFLLSGKFTTQVQLMMENGDPDIRLKSAIGRMSFADRIYLISSIRHMRNKLLDRIALFFWLSLSRPIIRKNQHK